MKAADLRKSILQAAVQGKLVPQDKNDEPAMELIKRIKKEKEQLIKTEKVKREKPLLPIADDEAPYDLPEGWAWTYLGEIILYTDAGKSPACENRPATENEFGVIRTTAVQINTFNQLENKVLSSNFSINPDMLIRSGDILITRAGPKNRTGIACLVESCLPNTILSDKTVRINCSNLLCRPYVVRALNRVY